MGAASSPSCAQTASSTSGGRWENVPTAPESLPTAIVARARGQAAAVALQLGVPEGQLQPEGHGLRVHAVGAADHGRVLVLLRPVPHRRQQGVEVVPDEVQASRMSRASAVSTTSEEVRP